MFFSKPPAPAAPVTDGVHPRDALFESDERSPQLPVCDHYAGVEARMRKSLTLQGEMGPVFDLTLDGEDGAPVGGEVEHAHLMAELVNSPDNRWNRVGIRVQTVDHTAFEDMVDIVVRDAGERVAYIMVPKPRHLADLEQAIRTIDDAIARHGVQRAIPVHSLVETHGALRDVEALAALPRVESLSFGLMDFVSAHRGAIPLSAMTAGGQFTHPLVLRAKLAVSAACHGWNKVPSHCVVTEFKHLSALQEAASKACRELGYTRMWSIHPDQIRPIVDAFSPTAAEVDLAIEILETAQAAQWGPIRHRHRGQDHLHDRASYRYFWHVLERAHRTSGTEESQLPAEICARYFSTP